MHRNPFLIYHLHLEGEKDCDSHRTAGVVIVIIVLIPFAPKRPFNHDDTHRFLPMKIFLYRFAISIHLYHTQWTLHSDGNQHLMKEQNRVTGMTFHEF